MPPTVRKLAKYTIKTVFYGILDNRNSTVSEAEIEKAIGLSKGL